MKIVGEIQNVPTKKLFPNKWNPNEQSDFMYEHEIDSIKTHGFVTAILVREVKNGYEIIDGEHRWRAATDLGFKEVRINNMGKVSDEDAQALTVILNEIKGKADPIKLASLMKDLSKKFTLQQLEKKLPFSGLEISAMIENAKIDWSQNQSSEGGGESVDKEGNQWEVVTLKLPKDIALRLNGQIERMTRLINPENPDKVNQIQAVEFLVVHLEQVDDKNLV